MPPILPVYCSPFEAFFALSEISSPIDFHGKLDRMLIEGLLSTGINIRRGTRENIRPQAFIDHRATLAGGVLTRRRLYQVSCPDPSLCKRCYLDFSDSGSYRAEQPSCNVSPRTEESWREESWRRHSSYPAEQPSWFRSSRATEQLGRHLDVERTVSYQVNQPRLVWYDLRFLAQDFLERQRGKTLSLPSSEETRARMRDEITARMRPELSIKDNVKNVPPKYLDDFNKGELEEIAKNVTGHRPRGRPPQKKA